MTAAAITKNEKALPDSPLEWSADELHEEGMSILRSFLEHSGCKVLEEGFGESAFVFRDPEDATTVLARVSLAAGSPDDESAMPELALGTDAMESIRRECLAYAMEHPECVSVRGDVISLIVFAGRQGRIRHLVGAYMWEE